MNGMLVPELTTDDYVQFALCETNRIIAQYAEELVITRRHKRYKNLDRTMKATVKILRARVKEKL